jgi:hypothetical protein
MNLDELKSVGLYRRLRNALVQAERAGKIPIRGACGSQHTCGLHWTDYHQVQTEFGGGLSATRTEKLPSSNKICILCAFVAMRGEEQPGNVDLEDFFAELLDIKREHVILLLQGWDGDARDDSPFYKLGAKLARTFVVDVVASKGAQDAD